ncbi:MAG: VacJ family lipoprotein [Gallionella sp.]|nr:VacJ family lipoprotein [Gallionella sp.]
MRITSVFFVITGLMLGGCASSPAKNPADPFEPMNRSVYQFNDALDRAVAKPVAQGYDAVMPAPGKIMVSNFFSNLDDIVVTLNDLLQFKFAQAASDGSRVIFNSTFGIFGLFDIANRLEKHNEDFGQTLGYWGVNSGPYLVLPVLGPSSVRDGIGFYVDTRPSQMRRVTHMRTRNQLYLTRGINRRAQLFEQEKVFDSAAIDRYELIRDAYMQRRQSLVYDGNPPRPNYDDMDFEEEDIPVHEPAPIDHEKVPIPDFSLSQQDHTPEPALRIAETIPLAEKNFEPPKVLKIWVAQRNH